MKKHLVLIGLPGSGKTTIGRAVAEQLHAGFVDIDSVLVRKEGKPITMIFAEQGEGAFRAMEREAMEVALANPPAVIAPGGGWAAQPGALDGARPRGFFIYLKTRAEVAAARAAPSGTRPLLMGENPEVEMRELFKEREPFYTKADATVQTEAKDVSQIAAEVVRLAQSSAGW